MNEDRQKLFDEYQGDKPNHLRHPWLDYDRYRYSNKIVATLKERGEDFNKLIVIDYGCGVGDYGFDFGRNGSEVIFYDNGTYINFVLFRLQKEPQVFRNKTILTDIPYQLLPPVNVAIFGEVLEHLDDPLAVLTHFVNDQTKYIFTSSYPFRNDNPNDDYWKHPGHEAHNTAGFQPACRDLLFENYTRIKYNGNASLWVKK